MGEGKTAGWRRELGTEFFVGGTGRWMGCRVMKGLLMTQGSLPPQALQVMGGRILPEYTLLDRWLTAGSFPPDSFPFSLISQKLWARHRRTTPGWSRQGGTKWWLTPWCRKKPIQIQTQIQKWKTPIWRRESDTKKRVMRLFDGPMTDTGKCPS